MDTITKLKLLATDHALAALKYSVEEHGHFRTLVTANIDGQPKPVLIVGNAHPDFDDCMVISVLNPDEELVRQIKPGVGYSAPDIKYLVSQRSDAMASLFILTTEGMSRAEVIATYKTKSPKTAKFIVQ